MKRGFTLIEVLVVVAIIALLMAILVPSLAGVRAEGRRTVCLSNLHQLGLATRMYLDDNKDYFWRDNVAGDDGLFWWFGFERDGPGPIDATDRPLDKKKGALARYLRSTDDGLQCPQFPYNSGSYLPKFAQRSASYGYNIGLGPRNLNMPTHRSADYHRQSSGIFVFADGVLYDVEPATKFREGFFIANVPEMFVERTPMGYAHFRHNRRAQVLYLDGHVEPQSLAGSAYNGANAGGPAGNLAPSSGRNSIYGYSY